MYLNKQSATIWLLEWVGLLLDSHANILITLAGIGKMGISSASLSRWLLLYVVRTMTRLHAPHILTIVHDSIGDSLPSNTYVLSLEKHPIPAVDRMDLLNHSFRSFQTRSTSRWMRTYWSKSNVTPYQSCPKQINSMISRMREAQPKHFIINWPRTSANSFDTGESRCSGYALHWYEWT